MNEKTIDKEISFIATVEDGKVVGYSAFLGGICESGITVTGETKEECIQELTPYLLDSFDELDNL